ncbi:uncharacterized protein F4807DRAFT_452194 [Annulohypoxylon truncatum]|uniref:uncharacterized protein n=1 Tax=Annulohypoxylon truncatum TaxID=327061 RepID=UPI002007ADFE|nr:uncharacterized protein F4807DRAFT_452194 [Annulohypoxylon truncatum]KAI1208514.1 hypothetical protein F4807DRAFT_452194 [Annulohypoxylon truncatum]
MNTGAQSNACFICKISNKRTYSCIQCNNLSFCNDCWSQWVLHLPGTVGYDNRPHEKAIAQVVQRLRQILEPSRNEIEHEQELLSDDDTTWFGVGRDSAGRPVFQDHGRFANLMSESQTQDPGNRYPQLVSFIGQTGAGKSTLIKMLIDRLDMRLNDQRTPFPSPVTSSNNDRVPTTGDVHLYADPISYYTKAPVLYADCEGLDGGEAIPRGLRHRAKENPDQGPETTVGSGNPRIPRPQYQSSSTNRSRTQSANTSSMHIVTKNKLQKNRHSSQREIVWAVTPETKKREYAVAQLYPRLLYTFSDVVVFVLKNPRAFESTVLEKLLQWGSSSIDKSLNQPALPHAVIVLNATDKADEKEWDTGTATNLFLNEIKGAVFREPRFSQHVRVWQATGRKVESTRDLLECYYASVTVVRVPSHGRYMLMDEQAEKLFGVIKGKCQESLFTKKRVRMLATEEKLQKYLQAAYDHFSGDLNTPFDFVKEALKHNPIPQDFGGNILNLAVAIKQNCSFLQRNAEKIFDKMVPMISSCIMLDAVRQNLLGTTTRLLNDAYVEFCQLALKEFADLYSPCTFRHHKYGQCCNVRVGHNPKGHQNESGKIFGFGGYQSSFDYHEYEPKWIERISVKLEELQKSFERSNKFSEYSEYHIAAEVHKKSINEFYRSLGNADKFKSHTACFSCLRELPEHALPCGHVLCLPCIEAYGAKVSKTTIELRSCPLHAQDTTWEAPRSVLVKPAFAGTRILCLDGGGIRGIVELQTLKAIEKILGPKLPIRLFFDLIVGTSTGGIIALGLGVNNWTVDGCIRNFKELCVQAFKPRDLIAIPFLKNLTALSHRSIFKTRPFEELLRRAFTEEPLFGGANDLSEIATKVAITTTSEMKQHAVVLANYNRQGTTEYCLPYRFDRCTEPEKEFKMWEAARATSAAPPFFKTFQKQETRNNYLDGALYHNNPVWVAHHERKLIWPDVCKSPPDILLSIGTGKNGLEIDEHHLRSPQTWPSSHAKPKPRKRTSLHSVLTIAARRFDNLLECNKIWDDYIAKTSTSDYSKISSMNKMRLIRLNPDLCFEVPRLDAVGQLERIEKAAIEDLHKNKAKVTEVAHRLIVSTFFFEKDPNSVKATEHGYECIGRIHCRFANSSAEMKALGGFLRDCLQEHFEPFFVVEEDSSDLGKVKHTIDQKKIEDMYLRGRFDMPNTVIYMSKEVAVTTISLSLQSGNYPHTANSYLPISGFPRELVIEGTKETVSKPRPRLFQPRHSDEDGSAVPHRSHSFKSPSHLRHFSSRKNLRKVFSDSGIPTDETEKPPSSPSLEVPYAPDDVRRWVHDRANSPGEFVNELEA